MGITEAVSKYSAIVMGTHQFITSVACIYNALATITRGRCDGNIVYGLGRSLSPKMWRFRGGGMAAFLFPMLELSFLCLASLLVLVEEMKVVTPNYSFYTLPSYTIIPSIFLNVLGCFIVTALTLTLYRHSSNINTLSLQL